MRSNQPAIPCTELSFSLSSIVRKLEKTFACALEVSKNIRFYTLITKKLLIFDHSHQKGKYSLETRAVPAVLWAYVQEKEIL